MNQNRSAAGLRRSAIAERIRLREEWSTLKGYDVKSNQHKEPRYVTKKIKKKPKQVGIQSNRHLRAIKELPNVNEYTSLTSEVLRGIVALVDVGAESRALALRAALTALGATVVPSWIPLVTHVIWSQGGSRETRAKARALACQLVSPLWVEGCAASAKRLPEYAFPAPTRTSDLPSPKTLRQLLKKYDMENIPLNGVLSDSDARINGSAKQLRLRWSSDTSTDKTNNKSSDISTDKTNVETRGGKAVCPAVPSEGVLTNPNPIAVEKTRSRRKLFTQKEVVDDTSTQEDSDNMSRCTNNNKASRYPREGSRTKLTQRERRELAQAERIARRLVAAYNANIITQRSATSNRNVPRIVLTGMNKSERRTIAETVRSLGGHLQNRINKKTTHVLLGSCIDIEAGGTQATNSKVNAGKLPHLNIGTAKNEPHKPRTVNALEGAARGCRVLHAAWATEAGLRGKWIHHIGYEVYHLRKICQRARFERAALGLQKSEYACDVFNGISVRIAKDAQQRDSVIHLLKLCGARIIDNSEQDGDVTAKDSALTVGVKSGEISSKWVFDSVAAGRIRTTRRYVNILPITDLDRLNVVR